MANITTIYTYTPLSLTHHVHVLTALSTDAVRIISSSVVCCRVHATLHTPSSWAVWEQITMLWQLVTFLAILMLRVHS